MKLSVAYDEAWKDWFASQDGEHWEVTAADGVDHLENALRLHLEL